MPIEIIGTRGRALLFSVVLAILSIALLPGAWGVAYGQTSDGGGGGGGGISIPGGPVTTTTTTTSSGSSATVAEVPASTATTVTSPAPTTTTTGTTAPTVAVSIPTGAISAPASVTVSTPQVIAPNAPLPPNVPPPPPVPAGTTATITAVFEMSAVNLTTGNSITTFDQPLTVTLTVPPETLALAATQGGQVTLQFFNEATNQWQSVSSTVNPATGQLTAPITHFSKWALIVIRGGTISGRIPAAGGYGLIVYGGGSLEALITATGCPRASMAIWMSRDGSFVPYIPGSTVAVVNEQFLAVFSGGANIPANTAFIGKCR